MEKLKPCPYCGGEADIQHKSFYMSSAYCVECKVCRTRTKLVFADTIGYKVVDNKFKETRYDTLTAIKMVVDLWNRRVNENV